VPVDQEEHVRFAVIGLGGATKMFHIPALRRIERADLVGGFDPAADRRAEWERATGASAYESIDELLERARPDVVVVATPPAAHEEHCLRAIAAGCHVFCEKPFADSVAQADRIVAAAQAAGRAVSVNHEFREHPIYRAVRDQVVSERHGRLAFCQVWQLLDLPPWDEPTAWRADMADRALFEGGIHLVDLLIWIFGVPPIAVSAGHSAGFHSRQDVDAVQLVTLEFPGGRLGQITMNRLTRGGTRYLEVRADCEEASLRASFGGRAYVQLGVKRAERRGIKVDRGFSGLAWAERGTSRSILARNPRNAGVVGATRLLEGLVDAIERGEEPPSSAREARDALAVIEAAYESARSGRQIRLDA
jgi:UDP-N-acetyl-2-amino-2-deoxyglucuronate dehydrogenase